MANNKKINIDLNDSDNEDIIKEYECLSKKCDNVITKVRIRKSKKQKISADSGGTWAIKLLA